MNILEYLLEPLVMFAIATCFFILITIFLAIWVDDYITLFISIIIYIIILAIVAAVIFTLEIILPFSDLANALGFIALIPFVFILMKIYNIYSS